ncbi:MAG: hypothetical protein Q8S73_29765 [Deltaproteobacteria bacterium]|nr:hypothetical protein [Myxococcales bacterium]MDP3218330.1 hypothetical protein [Deltaproteobacteria bacterium]
MKRHAYGTGLVVILAALAGCSSGDTPGTDAGVVKEDAPVIVDVGTDVGFDTGPDVRTDTGTDTGADTGTDLGADTGTDAGLDVGTDAGADVGTDAGTDVVDVVDVVDVPDVDECGDGGVRVDGGACLRCGAGERVCGGACVGAADPANGCGAATCAPCALPNATASCAAGACAVAACGSGFADCDGDAANGCEVDTRLSVAHCGACARACITANATPVCAAGLCAVASCAPFYADCDGAPGDGCEVDTRNDLNHCGGCGRACRLSRATARCEAGQCRVAACEAGFGDCNGDEADGCETPLAADPNHCGVCGVSCPEVCRGSVCEACSAGSQGSTCRGGSICRCDSLGCACRT